jgi:hypothetical protein
MENWLVEQEAHGDGAVLIGLVHGRRRTTNTILAYDADAGWAKTWSGLWRLGRPLDAALNTMVNLGGEDER